MHLQSGKNNWYFIENYTIADNQRSGIWYNESSFIGDGVTELKTKHDAAFQTLGSPWRMPTKAEIDELVKNCDWTWTKQGSVYGFVVKSKTNSNSIFLPAADYGGVFFRY